MDLEFYTLKRTETQILKSLDHKMEAGSIFRGKRLMPVVIYSGLVRTVQSV